MPDRPSRLAYEDWMTRAGEEYERLLRLLRGLEDEAWDAATDCAGWTVHDVAAHLVGAAAGTASVRELVRQAWLARRLGRTGDLVDRMNAVQVDERRAATPATLLADLESAARRGIARRRRIPAPVRAVRLPFGPPLGTRPLGYLTGRIYTRDAWMHRVDVSRATGAELELTTEHDGALVEDLVAEWCAEHRQPVVVRLDGPAGGEWRVGSGGAGSAVRMDAVDFARTISGRAAGTDLLATRVPF